MSSSTSVRSALAVSAVMILSFAAQASAATAVTWTSLVNATASGATLTKSKGCSTCFDAGGVSQQQVTSGSITFTVGSGAELIAGLGHDTSTSTSTAIDYAFHVYTAKTWDIREGGVYKTEGTFATGDQFSISISAGKVTYARNGTVVYTSKTTASGTYVMDSSLLTIGGAILNAQVSTSTTTSTSGSTTSTSGSTTGTSGSTGVSWTSLVNASASGSTVTKTQGCDTCPDAGGLSAQRFSAGTVSFSVTGGERLVVGVTSDTSNSTDDLMDFAFRFYDAGTWDIREAGVYKTEGAFAPSDVFSITVASGSVKYYRNGTLVRTANVTPAATLALGASLETIGASVHNAAISGSTATSTASSSTTSSSTTTTTSSSSSSSTSTSSTGSAKNLRVLQWNTHHGGVGTDGVYDPNRLATWAASFNPDVITFIEIERNDSWGNQDQPELYKSLLEQKTGKTWYYVFAQEYGQWDSSGKGNLILSSFPIQVSDRYELTQNNDRSIALATITVNSRDITLITTHLDPYDATLRLAQATEVTNWAAGQPENRILTGDMNAWPDQASIAEYDQNYNDSWAVAAANGTAVAFPGNNGETKSGRIDYIFSSKTASNLSVVSSQVYDTADANGVTPSDHRPVLTVFAVR